MFVMKNKLQILFLILLSNFYVAAQKEIEIFKTHDGFKITQQYLKNDTLEIVYFPDGKIHSKKKAFPGQAKYTHSRYYQNGNLMWERSFKNGKNDGQSAYYNEKGKKIISINYLDGNAIDTLVHSTKQTVVLGNYSYWSRVYGGAQNEDGTSNIQEMSGPTPFFELYLIEIPISKDVKKQNLIKTRTDQNGDFMVILNTRKQTYGIFPFYFDQTNITGEMLFPPNSFENSSNTAWSLSKEIILDWNTSFLYTELKSSSVGYAP